MDKDDIKYIKYATKNIEELDANLRHLGTKSTPDIVGFYGELLAWQELKDRFERKGYKIGLGHGQTRADIKMEKNNKALNIEVKTSRFKKEWYGEGHGFAVNIKKCKIHKSNFIIHPKREEVYGDFCYFDYLITVSLSEDLRKKEFHIFSRSFFDANEKKLRNINKRFSSATHRLIFIKNDNGSKETTEFDRKLSIDKNNYKDWNIIDKK
jgi:hypothetical protein